MKGEKIKMRNKAELAHLGQSNGWQIKPVTQAEIRRMSSDEYEWNERFNSENLQKAISEPGLQAEADRERIRLQGKSIWSGLLAADDFYEEQARWVQEHPQFISTCTENVLSIASWMRERNLVPSAQNVDAAFVALTLQGCLLLDAFACGAGPETEVTGFALARHQNLHMLLEPVRKPDAATERMRKMSADAFRAATPELHESKRLPPFAHASVKRALSTFILSNREYVASEKNRVVMMQWLDEVGLPPTTGNLQSAFDAMKNQGLLELNSSAVNSGSTRLVDYGPRQTGYPKESEKYSFKKLVRDFTADELKQRILDDPNFERGLDNL